MSWLDRIVSWEGSTRQLALLRIIFGLVIWSEYATKHAFYANHDPARQAFGALLVVAAGFMVVGWFSRLATATCAAMLVFGYHYLGVHLGIKEPFVHAHSYLLMVTVCMLALMPTGRSLSVDRWLALRRQDAGGATHPPERGVLWPLALLRLQLALVYFWGAYDKTSWAFLSGARLQQIFYYYYGSHEGLRVPFADPLLVAGAVYVVVLEFALAFGLWFPRARRWLVPQGIVMHFLFYMCLPVGTFSVTSLALYLAFVSPQAVHIAMDRLFHRAEEPGAQA